LVKIMYENTTQKLKNMTVKQFVRFESSSYITGDIARIKEKNLGREECQFIANAIAVFGGYNDYSEVED
ncbi:MAG: hypothetical protein Q4B70_19520, partial [Lachnospiraceae bacterium]|nr:hypothetical protein [Lachnospiraceae bacterium]